MRPATWLCLLLLCAASPAVAQDPLFGAQRSAWGPRLDTLGAAAATRVIWRGYDLGAGGRAGASVGLWGRAVTAAGAWSLAARLGGHLVAERGAGGSRGTGALEVVRMLGTNDALLRGWAGAYALHDVPGSGLGGDFGVRLEQLAVPWLPEVWPTLRAGITRSTGPLEGTYLDVALRQTVGIQQYAVRFEGGADWDDAGRDTFSAPRWRGEAGVSMGVGRTRWELHLEGGALGAHGAVLGWGGAAATWRY